ncbi:LacI family DNA-binding transcriptional regulator [Mesorhizobium sp. CN2-181]|uniref:LacI family DNA-binding transcriptional regulator n=1 Tax=Mesorhizobium yinganensis TaxID=3157707 RepID=UPI0032B749EA
MSRPFLAKDIALQAGVSLATVDRVLNGREGVRQHTVRRVEQAIRELGQQRAQVGIVGRKFILDLVMEAPVRFSDAVRSALETEMPALHPAVFRCRHHLSEKRTAADTVSLLDAIRRRGSNGVLLKAPDVAEIVSAVDRLVREGIPVVALVTDLPNSRRHAYVGVDNRAAGETAAYLIGEWLGSRRADVLVTLSSSRFRGEEEREIGFRRVLRERYPSIDVVEVSEGYGIDGATGDLVHAALRRNPGIAAVYSAGGGNAAIVQAFAEMRRPCHVFIGHDLDADNLVLLRSRRISAVLHHDLRQDMRSACIHVMQAQGALPKSVMSAPSNVSVITPFNMPAAPV